MSTIIPTIQKTLKRVDRSLSGPLVVFSEQFLYGHREIICAYAGLDPKAMIKGSIEHGWSLDAGRGIPTWHGDRYLYLSWSDERLMRSKNSDKNAKSIGAPFIYAHDQVLRNLGNRNLVKRSPRRETLFFPVHGNEYTQQNGESQISLFRESHNPNDSAVCLYWAEFINPDIYNLYKSAGFEILCAGFSGQMEHTGLGYSARKLAGSPIGGRPTFLLNTIAFLSSYPKIVLGGFGSICYYAAFLNCEIEMLHKYFDTEFLDMDTAQASRFSSNYDEVRFRNYVSQFMQAKFENVDFNSDKFRELARVELGYKNLKSQSELKEFLTPHLIMEANPQSLGVYEHKITNFQSVLDSIN